MLKCGSYKNCFNLLTPSNRPNGGSVSVNIFHYPALGGAPIGEAIWSHNDQTIAIYGGDGKVYLLDTANGTVKSSFFSGVVYSLSWSPDDTRLVTGNYNNVAQVWRLP